MTDHDTYHRLAHVESAIALATTKLAALVGEADQLREQLADNEDWPRPTTCIAPALGENYARSVDWGMNEGMRG